MGQSYRIRTELGINKTINVQLDQDFEFLEVLSLKIQQADVYNRNCADYGVIVGRVTANNGFGLPNARVSIFIPIDSVDQSNPLISSIYPYKSPTDKNEDGYRYNLLPYEKSYSSHAATGTLPSRLDVLTGSTAIEIYDKYYKFTAKTNESGDYMIMGVPLGYQTIVMDVDLSDIGEFSLTPQDLIRMGLATEAQVAGNRFRTSSDLNSLPQIINIVKNLDISPLWGDPDNCQIAINRMDFDLRDNANINIQPTAVFMGSMYSTADEFRVRPEVSTVLGIQVRSQIKDNMGNLCSLTTGPGQIVAIRQTIAQDTNGLPILERYQLEQSGNIIDGNGVWLTELPMNLEYVVTNEFGEKVISNDPTIGIPTKGKYRFKIKWQQPPTLTQQVRRAYYLVPNVKEYGWVSSANDPNMVTKPSLNAKLAGSYYFGLDWSGYTNVQAAVNCDDTFYQFEFNKVYTVSGFIDEFKSGEGKGQFIGIKEIDSNECSTTVNKFPVNDGFRNFDLIYFLFSIIFQVIQIIGVPLISIYHFVAFLWKNFALPISALLIKNFLGNAVLEFKLAYAMTLGATGLSWGLVAAITPFILKGILWAAASAAVGVLYFKLKGREFPKFKLPMITYPDCQACECTPMNFTQGIEEAPPPSILLSQLSNSTLYYENLVDYETKTTNLPQSDPDFDTYMSLNSLMKSQAVATSSSPVGNPFINKTQNSTIYTFPSKQYARRFSVGMNLSPGERINIYNLRNKYFNNVNKIKVTFASNINTNYHYDNTLTVLSSQDLPPGTLLTFINPQISKDKNYKWTGTTAGNGTVVNGIYGTLQNKQFNTTVEYANPTNQFNNLTTTYVFPQSNVSPCVTDVTISATTAGLLTYLNCQDVQTGVTVSLGVQTISDINCINITSFGGDAEVTILSSGDTCQRYIYPSDIEYYQVLTAVTITKTIVAGVPQYSIPNLGPNVSFFSNLNIDNVVFNYKEEDCGGWTFHYNNTLPTSFFADYENQKILILQRGVDPYSPKFINKYGVGVLFGTNENDPNWTFTASTRTNVPIQKLPSGSKTSVQQHDNPNNILFQSKFFTPGLPSSTTPGYQYSAFTTSNVGYYGALDSKGFPGVGGGYRTITTPYTSNYINIQYTISSMYVTPLSVGTSFGVVSKSTNRFYSNVYGEAGYYDGGEDLSGGAILYKWPLTGPTKIKCSGLFGKTYYAYIGQPIQFYFSPILYPTVTGTSELNITVSTSNVFRTDRLPSSDYLDSLNPNGSNSLLQQNLGFNVYFIGDSVGAAGVVTSGSYNTGAEQVTANLQGQIARVNLLTTLGTCNNMVGLTCYSGNGVNFGVSAGCQNNDSIENGCYTFMGEPLTDLQKDLDNFSEWGYRFRFFYGLCRGVLSQTFTNNWVNGSLYTFPIQVNTYYDSLNKTTSEYPKDIIYYDDKTTNFYYRSSPYLSGTTSQRFIGKETSGLIKPVNKRNLLFPTTIINLGIKDDFYQEIIFDPSAKGYIMKSLTPSSYSDTSDLVNLFVISRITSSTFLGRILASFNNSLNQLFSRPEKRIDGDLAQTMSINSEYGVVPFSPQYYTVYGLPTDPVEILGGPSNPTMAVFFSSTTENLQNKDFITPGVIDFKLTPPPVLQYPYGIKSQYVPFYQWGLKQNAPNQYVFGSDLNNWVTTESSDPNKSGIFGFNYQSLSRQNITLPSYFIGSNTQLDNTYERGYIFNVDSNGNFSANAGTYPDKFLVGAPYQFYFGVIKGQTALDKFKTKYSIDE